MKRLVRLSFLEEFLISVLSTYSAVNNSKRRVQKVTDYETSSGFFSLFVKILSMTYLAVVHLKYLDLPKLSVSCVVEREVKSSCIQGISSHSFYVKKRFTKNKSKH